MYTPFNRYSHTHIIDSSLTSRMVYVQCAGNLGRGARRSGVNSHGTKSISSSMEPYDGGENM